MEGLELRATCSSILSSGLVVIAGIMTDGSSWLRPVHVEGAAGFDFAFRISKFLRRELVAAVAVQRVVLGTLGLTVVVAILVKSATWLVKVLVDGLTGSEALHVGLFVVLQTVNGANGLLIDAAIDVLGVADALSEVIDAV
jgi:hypothetical protein